MGVSYKLSGWDAAGGCIGGPEKPLSELGQKSYNRFWAERIARYFLRTRHSANKVDLEEQKPKSSPKASKKRPSRESMTVEEIGLATGMLTEDVITAVKSMGIVQPETPRKRKMPRISGDSDLTKAQTIIIHKADVWKWAKAHHLSLDDPVREEGFILPLPVSEDDQSGSEEE